MRPEEVEQIRNADDDFKAMARSAAWAGVATYWCQEGDRT